MGGLVDAFLLGLSGVLVWAMVKILHKAGYSGWWVVLTFIPVVNIAAILRFGFADWPAHQALRVASRRLEELDAIR